MLSEARACRIADSEGSLPHCRNENESLENRKPKWVGLVEFLDSKGARETPLE